MKSLLCSKVENKVGEGSKTAVYLSGETSMAGLGWFRSQWYSTPHSRYDKNSKGIW